MGVRKLFLEVGNASDLMPKDGQGSANAYCVIEFDGQRQKTDVRHKDLNPVWNTVLEFTVPDPQSMESQLLHITLFNTKRPSQRQPSFLGRVKIRGTNFSKHGEEAMVYYKLKRRSLLSQVKGEIGLKVWWIDEPDPPPPEEAAPPPTPAEAPAAEAAPPAQPESAAPPANEPAPEAPAPPPEPAPEPGPPAEATPETPPAPPADPPAQPAPPAEPPAPEAAPPVAPPAEAAPAEAEAAPPAAAEETKPEDGEEKKEEEASKDNREDERIEVIEKAMMMKLQPVYWDHNQPYAWEAVPWNNFIVASFLENPYTNLPLEEESCCCH